MFSLDSTTQVDLGKLKPKDYYQLLNNKTHTAHQTGTQKWNKTFPLNENNWCQLFKSIPKLCQEQKLREFQFKFIHRIVVTRKKLFKFRIKPNSDCIYCGEEDSIEHTFKDCSFTKSFIEKTLEWFNNTNKCNFTPSEKDILFGIFINNTKTGELVRRLNYTFLFMRYYIYSAKLEEKVFSVQEFMRKILLKYKIEKLCSSNIVSNR